ncbi:MAG: hypothetical protein ACHQ4H_15765 [Ktedonobacterales bacterium]
MKALGPIIAIIGIIVGLVAVANYTVLDYKIFARGQHMDLIVGVVGAVLVIIGVVLAMMGGRKAAA